MCIEIYKFVDSKSDDGIKFDSFIDEVKSEIEEEMDLIIEKYNKIAVKHGYEISFKDYVKDEL